MRRIAAPLHLFRPFLTALICATLLAGNSHVAAAADARRPEFVEGEILISFRPDARPQDVQAILRDLGAKPMRKFRRTKAERHKITKPVLDAVAKYRQNPAVRFIEPNYILHSDAVPNDASFPLQWSLQNTGQSGGKPGADIHAVPAWDQTTGSSQVVIAIVDTGMDMAHPDLAANLYTNPGEVPDNLLDDDGNGLVDDVHGFDFANFDGDPTDDNGHGTHVAGTIGAVGNNGIGVVGVTWRVRLMPLKFLDGNGSGSTSDAIDCIDYAVDAGVTAINASWGGGQEPAALRLAISDANDAGVLFVAAAGNTSSNNDAFPNFPSNFDLPNIIAVGSSARSDERSGFSSYGATTVDLFAPGTQILSTLPHNSYGQASGTSMATPHVTGALALLKARFPTMLAPTMKAITLAATDRIPALAGLSVTGGRLNVAHMLEGVDSTAPAPVANLAGTVASSDRITVRWTATGDDGSTGTATEYDLRYSTSPIDAASFAAATHVTGVTQPHPAGTPEEAVIRGLTPLTDYFIALVVRDEFGNASPLSNVTTFRTTAPPVAVVDPPALARDLRTGEHVSLSVDLRNDGAGDLDFTARTAGSGGGPAPGWIFVAPQGGSVTAGAHSTLTVTLSAAGLRGGDYAALVRLETNDPARRTLDVPVALHVISAPDIEVDPPQIAFGPVAVGRTEIQPLLVTNAGFSDLHVTRISVEGVGYTVDDAPFDLTPGASWELYASVTPPGTGPVLGTLSIECDDPDEPTVRIPLGATGIVPAAITVTPNRESATLHTGQTATRLFTIGNTGGSALSWTVRTRAAGTLAFDSTGTQVSERVAAPPTLPAPTVGAAGAEASQAIADLSDVRIVFDARHGASSGAWSGFIGSLVSGGAVFTVNTQPLTAEVLAQVDVYWISDAAGAFGPAERAALAAWVRSGGSLLIEGAEPVALPEFDSLLDSLGVPVSYDPGQGITGRTERLYPYEITRGTVAANLPSISRLRMEGAGAALIIEDALGFPAMAASFVGRGRVLAVAGRLFADVSAIYDDNRTIATQSLGWLGGAAWLTVTPPAGVTQPGQTSTVTARFDGDRLAGAEYRAAIVFRSNDPLRTDFLVPVDLTVTPAPDVEVAPASVDFGPVFLGASRRDSVIVRNVGAAPLLVTSIAVDHPDVLAQPGSFSLAPGITGSVILTYAPTAVGPISPAATLTMSTDDPDEPGVAVRITGSGAPAPDIEIAPSEVSASLQTGTSAARTVTIANRAGSPLEFSIHFEEAAPSGAAGVASSGGSRAAALPRTWAQARAAAASAAGRIPVPVASKTLAPASLDSLPLVVADPRGDGGVADALLLRAGARGGVLSVELTTATDIIPLNFGGYVSLDLDQNPNTGREPSFGNGRQDIGAEFEIGFFSIAFGYVDLFDAHNGNYMQSFPVVLEPRAIRFAVPLSWLQDDDGRMNVSGVIGNAVEASDWIPGRGHGTIGGLWVMSTPASGTVAAGAEMPVTLTLDALALPAGAYHGSVIVESNDPDEPVLTIAAAMTVTDGPLIQATATRVDLGHVFLGRSSDGEIIIANAGTATLTVASAAVDLADFVASPASFTVPPGRTQTVHLTFTPSAEGSREGTLTFAHDAPGAPVAVGITGVGLVAPVLQVAPSAIEAQVTLGDRGSVSLQIKNGGGSTLEYGVEAMKDAPPAAPPAAAYEALFVDRDAEDPRPGFSSLGTGGPDAFGYRWVDSKQPGGPIFDWQEISAIGTPVPIQRLDQNSGPLPIGFSFPFYDQVFTTFNVCTHGYISFTDTTAQFANQPLPSGGAPANLLAVFWDDLNFAGVEHAFYYNDGTRLIVEYSGVSRRQRGGPFTFQVILYPSGAIVYQYLLMGAPVTSGTIGIQNRTKGSGLTVVFDDAYLHDGMAIRFSAAPNWMSISERFGTLEAGESTSVVVSLDVRGFFAGTYTGSLRVSSNDPDHREAVVPVTLRVIGISRIFVTPSALEFDTLSVGESATDTLSVVNVGNDLLEASLASESADFTFLPSSVTVGPQQSTIVLVRFQPVAAGDRSTSILVTSNDPVKPVTTVSVTAAARLLLRELAADVSPATFQRGSKGKQIRARIVLPADLDAARVLLPGVRLMGTVPLELADTRLRDLNGDGRADLDLAFARDAVERALPDGAAVVLAITGEVQGVTSFVARDTVRVIGKRFAAPGIEVEDGAAPAVSALHANAPNPFGAATAFRFDLASPGSAALRVYAANGRLVRTLLAAPLPAGRFHTQWDGKDDRGRATPSGVYFARMEVGGPEPFRTVRRWIRVR